MKSEIKNSLDKLNCALDLNRKVVGIKFLYTKEEFDSYRATAIEGKINYCVMVKSATLGHSIKATGANLACAGGARALGFEPIDTVNNNGENWLRLGLYKDAETAKGVREKIVYCTEKPYGILIQPLESFEDNPHVILIVTNSYNAMRIVQGYSYEYGVNINTSMVGNQAICSECTSRPYMLKEMNVSLLCIGTRHRAGWRDEEMSLGIPIEQFSTIVKGVFNTINIMDNNEKKKIIEDKLKAKGIEDLKIEYNSNYYQRA